MAPDHVQDSSTGIPVLLLKTESSPTDAYRELFSSAADPAFVPRFVPVLQHRFEDAGLSNFENLISHKQISDDVASKYGGIIFTSQRAVEAFTKLVNESTVSLDCLKTVPIYSVGPATTRALEAIPLPLRIFGSHTGNGEALAHYMLEHYAAWYPGRKTLPSLLFPVGEQRRDIIPKTLMDPSLPCDRRINVTEEVVYGTGVMKTFPEDFTGILEQTKDASERWVVVFSPTGCDGMLKGLGILDPQTGQALPAEERRRSSTYVITIGPTTQQFLRDSFGFEPDASAEKPSPQGVWESIQNYRNSRTR